jgi:cellulose biosynthesis protein BcsQ
VNWRHKPESDKELRALVAPAKQIVEWIKSRRGLLIGVGILKGGTGKSTSVLYIALYFARVLGLRVAVIDTDDNSQSLTNWVTLHKALGESIPFDLHEHPVKGKNVITLEKRVKNLHPDYDVIIVDLGGGDKETFTDLCQEGDLLLMPSAPSGWETVRIQATLQTAARAARLNLHGLAVYNFFVKCNFQTTLAEEEREAMAYDRSAQDEDFIQPPFLHPYFDVSSAPHHIRSWHTAPKVTDLEEWGSLIRHAMVGVMAEEDAA